MTRERRQQIEEVLVILLPLGTAERAARLDLACANDPELRRELESLLAQESRADRFLEIPALEVGARALARDEPDGLIGRSVGPYRIDRLLGAGGMGEVYYGWDTRLMRAVALKFLPKEYMNDAAALDRFRLEARAASALSHPNICVVHDVGDLDGRPFIAMEYLEGQTLRACMSACALPQSTALIERPTPTTTLVERLNEYEMFPPRSNSLARLIRSWFTHCSWVRLSGKRL